MKKVQAGEDSVGIEIFIEIKNQISVVLIDMIMPKMGGRRYTRR